MRHAFRALRHRDFALFWSGALVSNVGGWMQQATVPWVLFKMTGSAAWIGLAAFMQFVPMMGMNAVGGVLADRIDRKRILITMQAGLMGLSLLLYVLWEAGQVRPGVLVALVAAAGVLSGVQAPTWHSFVPQLVPREHLLNAVALNSGQFNVARAVGPALAGLVMALWDPGAVFLVNSITFLFVIAALSAVRTTQPEFAPSGRGFGGDFRAGLAYARSRPAILLAIGIVAVTSLIGAPVVQFTAVFADEVFRVKEVAFGLLTAAFGVGAVAATLFVGAYGDEVPRSRLASVGVLALGAGALILGSAPAYAVGLAGLLFMGAGGLIVVVSLSTSIQLLVREDMRGRVMALFMMSFAGAFPLGALIEGRVVDWIGVRPTVIGAGGVVALIGLALLASPHRLSALDAGTGSPGSLADSAAMAPQPSPVAGR